MDKKERYEKRMKRFEETRAKTSQLLDEKNYLATIYQTGHTAMSFGDPDREVAPNRFYKVCSLKEIPEIIQFMREPFWTHPKGLSKKEIENIPHKQKQWGLYYHVNIEPLSKEMEESYVKASKDGFFESWREQHRFAQKLEEEVA